MAVKINFNPFSRLFETKKYPHARERRTTFGQKCRDTFVLFFGPIPFTRYQSAGFGLFDYGLFPLSILSHLFIGIGSNVNHTKTAARVFFSAIGALFALPRLIITSALTLVLLPFIGIAHGFSQIKGGKLKSIIKDSDVQITDDNGKSSTIKMDAYLKAASRTARTHLSLSSNKNLAVLNDAGTGFTIYFNHSKGTLIADETNAHGAVIRAKGTKFDTGSAVLTYSLKDTKSSEIKAKKKVMKAYRKLNIGQVQEQFEAREEQEAKKPSAK